MKDKLREFLKTGTHKTVMRGESGRYPNGEGWGHSWNEEVVEFNAKKLDAALIDAEGDGGAAQPQASAVADVKAMVNRFLSWRLPNDFAPDAGISFNPGPTQHLPHCWPTGTCLFTAAQAEQMVRYMLDAPQPKVQP